MCVFWGGGRGERGEGEGGHLSTLLFVCALPNTAAVTVHYREHHVSLLLLDVRENLLLFESTRTKDETVRW